MTESLSNMYGPPPNGVDLWYTPVDKACDQRLLEQYRSLLAPDEAQQAQRFVFEKHRQQYLVTRGLVRTTLSHYFDVEPRDWVFVQDRFGKPHVAGPIEIPLAFNISHTEGLVICGVAALPMLGVDVERIDRDTETLTIANRFFAGPEVEYLGSVEEADRRKSFFQIWTLKEAYIKARGKGLSMPLGDFAFHFAAGAPAVISFLADLQDDPRLWRFVQLQLASYRMAIAARCDQEASLQLRMCETVPLLKPGELRLIDVGRGEAVVTL